MTRVFGMQGSIDCRRVPSDAAHPPYVVREVLANDLDDTSTLCFRSMVTQQLEGVAVVEGARPSCPSDPQRLPHVYW